MAKNSAPLLKVLSDLGATTPSLDIYTDGACSGNPGPGGWGAVLIYKDLEMELSGSEPETTNNRMEMMAAIQALSALPHATKIDLYTDSTYLKDGTTQWMVNWKKKNWRTAAGKPVKNQDLWERIDQLVNRHQITWHWVKAHNGDQHNEHADALARNASIAQEIQAS